jgi:hypothetical protein
VTVTTFSQRIILASAVLLLLAGCTSTTDTTVVEPAPTQADVSTPEPSATPEPIVDGGPREMANGTAAPNADGTVAYVVAEGDVAGVICDRFGLSGQQLQFEDSRGGASCYVTLSPGDALNLSTERRGE